VVCSVDGDGDLSEEDLDDVDIKQQYDGKIGTKKLRKLEEKAARKAQREVCSVTLLCISDGSVDMSMFLVYCVDVTSYIVENFKQKMFI